MPRPRIHDLDLALDAAEALAVSAGPAAVTIRAVAAATGMSNGALYHSFGSRGELVGRTWIRAAHRFLALQAELVAAATDPVEAVLAAAGAPAVFAQTYPASTQLFFRIRRDDLLGGELPEPLRTELTGTQTTLVELMKTLARGLWDRADAAAVDTMTLCLVDLPTAILLDRDRLTTPLASRQLRAAVHAILDLGPAPARRR
ncbi:TetR/AcrR family transcriptional regulator [Nocardia yunnanensis]|uniref:TetR/AcrR family transcriptional regulator n=1 Tax=Nocardia yunnanensis TaxID=2382165 RepID=A0A386ZDZ2_9NOCA|nr:TetR/AcrR family transcriptional regulator [Nocardia yunnanensis]AYF75746.1 TetR/AcrR family transcriptional regulator [Nocardia yunnanensis]